MKAKKEVETMTITATNTMIGGRCNNTDNEPDSDSAREYVIVADAMAGVGPFAVPLTSSSSFNSSSNLKAKIIVDHCPCQQFESH